MRNLLFFAILSFSFSAMSNPCREDQKQFCSSIEPGKGQIFKCLSDYEGQLSSSCKEEMKSFKAKNKKRNPCFEDLVEYCSAIPADKAKIEMCLLKNENRLSQTCMNDFKNKKGKILTQNICAQDVVTHCYTELNENDGNLSRCLFKNETKLSTFCKNLVQKKIKKMKETNPCFDETEKLCSGLTKFTEIHPCLVKSKSKLSAKCAERVNKEEKKIASSPCYMDLKTHCVPGLNPIDQQRCLDINKEHLSNKCSQFMLTQKTKVQSMITNCEADRIKFCANEPFEGGKVSKCLKKFKAQLSPACSKLI